MKNCGQEVANKENVPDADADADTKSLTPSGQKQYVSPGGRHKYDLPKKNNFLW